MLRKFFRRLLFPGFDIHTRSRAMLSRHWDFKDKVVLDAGSGNGYFVMLAHKAGAKKAIGISFDDGNTIKANDFFSKEVEQGSMSFKTINLYEVENFFKPESVDSVICYETIEHLMNDVAVVKSLFKILKPGGVLHLCAPNKLHFEHANITPSVTEDGWHVRKGYDKNDFTSILENAGFKISFFSGVGNKTTYMTDHVVRTVRNRAGHIAAFPFFFFANAISKIKGYECNDIQKAYSIYANAIKPPTS